MSQGTKRLLLINPANTYRKGYLLRRESKQAPLGLGMVAALTPPDWQVKIWDENFREFRFREADLVGITAVTASVNRAYEIAAVYRGKGIPVILGGIHASYLPDEALQYVDSVVIGEAEGVWEQVIRDFESDNLKPCYQAPLCEMKHVPAARHDLFHPGYLFASIQTSRGCPMDCDFCSVPAFNGNKYRLRDVENVLDEIESVPHPMLYFVDDNIIGYNKKAEEHAVALFEGMIRRGLKKDWFAQASLNIAEKPEILKLAARSGCRMLLIGIEAENETALESTNKKLNLRMGVDSYKAAYRTLHKQGINVLGAFIYGMESDTVEAIRNRTNYILKSSVDVTQASVMTPLPGTKLYRRMKDEGRILCTDFPQDWQHFHFTDVVFQPGGMTPKELAEAVDEAYGRIASMGEIRRRFLRTWWNTKSLRSAVWAWNSNLNYRSIAKEKKVNYMYNDKQ
ncbi:MAG: B12-binding domain-containing radical SAM protein [Bacteroidales bacterium]|nr:B12-binding domain-containing radical SAM protein [Bacteroidales bacterium]